MSLLSASRLLRDGNSPSPRPTQWEHRHDKLPLTLCSGRFLALPDLVVPPSTTRFSYLLDSSLAYSATGIKAPAFVPSNALLVIDTPNVIDRRDCCAFPQSCAHNLAQHRRHVRLRLCADSFSRASSPSSLQGRVVPVAPSRWRLQGFALAQNWMLAWNLAVYDL